MASVNRDEEQRWVPTHVQVLVIRARGLRAKGKHGTSDAYTVVQLGKEKYSTCVMEKTTEPEWGEECSFELQPGVLDDTGRDGHPASTCELTLTVMHRALIGLDVFLGQTVISLDKAFRERVCIRNEWYKLHSKTGKKEKERGELQLTVQFTRHNLTASMYDLSMKDKPRSAFIRLRERMRARKRGGDEESSSAILPGGYGALGRTRGRLPSDGGGEEDYEDDEGGELRRSKMRSYFLHGRLRKSSDTRSSTSLGSESSESSSRGGSLSPTAGISVVVSDLSNSPSNSSNLTADNSPEHTVAPSPLVSPVRHVFEMYDHSIPVPHSLSTDSDAPILLPSVCVNGNPVETSPLTHQPPSLVLQQQQQPRPQAEFPQESSKTSCTSSPPDRSKHTQAEETQPSESKPQPSPELQPKQPEGESKPKPDLQFSAVGLLQKGSALSLSLQNLSRHKEEQHGGGPIEGRRWSFDKPGEEEKAVIAAALEHAGLIADEAVVETAVPVRKVEVHGKKKRGLFSHSQAEKEETGQAQSATEGRHRGWFSSKDPQSKPRQNPFFQELHTVTPVIPALPFPCSPAVDLPEVPASRLRNPTPPLHVAEPGNANGNLVKGSSQNLTASFCRTDASDVSDGYKYGGDVTGCGLMLNSKMGTENVTVSMAESTKQKSTCCKGGLNMSKARESLCNLTPVGNLTVKVPPKHCSADLNNPPTTTESELDSSLHHNSSIDFCVLNALACPYPLLLNCTCNKGQVCTVSVCQTNVTPDAVFVSSVTPEPSKFNSESLHYLDLDGNSEHKTSKSVSSKHTDLMSMPSLPYCNLDIVGASSESKFLLKDRMNSDDDLEEGGTDADLQSKKASDSPPHTLEGGFRVDCLTEPLSGPCEVDAPNGGKERLSVAASQHVLSHSLYLSVDSEQYLTCMSQDNSHAISQLSLVANHQKTQPNSESSQEDSGRSVPQDPVDISQEALQKIEATSQDVIPNPPVSLSFLPKLLLEECEVTKEAMKDSVRNESEQKYKLPRNTVVNKDLLCKRLPHMYEVRVAEEPVTFKPYTFNNICSAEPPPFHCVQSDDALKISTDFCQSTENTGSSDFVSEPTSSITQDLVTTDFLLENVFVAQRALTHSVCTCPVTRPAPRETRTNNLELCPGSIKESQISKNKLTTTTEASVPQSEHLEGTLRRKNKQPPFSKPSTLNQVDSEHCLPMKHFPDLLPLASSTPHIAVGINNLPQFPFAMPSASAKPLPHATLSPAALSPVFTQSNNSFPREERHGSSPHLVKPLTPPDEKRADGRSVLDKLKSTIHPGRVHQGDPEHDRKLLVEGGGSYYHLNHSELVSLLLQRDSALQQERGEYDRRGLLLEKREVEIKKMKVLIKDLEDYIDTLLVRIMEQTPALLQVRSKMK